MSSGKGFGPSFGIARIACRVGRAVQQLGLGWAARRALYCTQNTNPMHTTDSTIKSDTVDRTLIRLSCCMIRKRDNGS